MTEYVRYAGQPRVNLKRWYKLVCSFTRTTGNSKMYGQGGINAKEDS